MAADFSFNQDNHLSVDGLAPMADECGSIATTRVLNSPLLISCG
jgi:hypothetical protein